MMLESFVLYIARDMIVKQGKSVLEDEEKFYGIIVQAFIEMDRVQNKPIKSNKEYVQMTINSSKFNYMQQKLLFLYDNLDQKKFDTRFDLEEKKRIMKNSIAIFEIFFQDLKQNYDYQKFSDDNKESKIGDYIIYYLNLKIENKKELIKILHSMENIQMNFIINYNGQNIYPIITDLLIDIVAAEYQWSIDKNLNQKIIEEWGEAKEAYKERKKFGFIDFTKIELIEKIKYHNLRPFILAEYARILNIEKKELRKFMQHILYHDVGNHKNTPKLEFDIINDISRRPFLLEKTKFVIGGI